MGTSYILTKEKAMQAVEVVHASFSKLIELGISERTTLHIVIMDPAKRPEFSDTFEDSILYEASYGDAIDRYKKIATGKAKFTWTYGVSSQEGQQFYPHLYTKGMTKWGGGTFLHRIAVGASGVEYQYDQLVAEMVASTCRALSIDKMTALVAGENDFLNL